MTVSRRPAAPTAVWLCVALVVSFGLATPQLASPAHSAAATSPSGAAAENKPAKKRKCRSGWVALTFDDGPAVGVTPKLVRILLRKHVPATFFMVGERVASAPSIAKLVAKSGFQIANHSYRHRNMTEQSATGIRRTLRQTQRELHRAGIKKPSRLMRPPYGAINRRVARVIHRADYVPVLWNADSVDWSGGGPATIARRVLRALDRGTNIVLQHDGIRNSPNSVAAVPRIVRVARKRGFCFTEFDKRGNLIVPKPKVSLRSFEGREGQQAAVGVRLSHPTPYPTSVYLSTQDGPNIAGSNSATGGIDYEERFQRVDFPPGKTLRVVHLAITPDEVAEPDESFLVNLSSPIGALLTDATATIPISDTRKPPAIAIDKTKVSEPQRGRTDARVTIRLGRASGNDVHLTLTATPDTADLRDFTPPDAEITIPAGDTSVTIEVPVRADRQEEGREKFRLTLTDVENAWVFRSMTTVTILDADVPRE